MKLQGSIIIIIIIIRRRRRRRRRRRTLFNSHFLELGTHRALLIGGDKTCGGHTIVTGD